MNKTILKIIFLAVLIALVLPISVYAMGSADTLMGTVSIVSDGTPQYGDTLSADISNVQNNTGILSYQWLRNGTEIAGAVSNTYTLTEGDIGSNIAVKVYSSVEMGEIISSTVLAGKADRAAPAAPTLDTKDNYSVSLSLAAGCEYKISGGSFSSANTFGSLVAGMEYTFYQRYAETALYNASSSSAALVVTTDYIAISNTSYNIGTLKSGDGVIVSGTVTLRGTQSIRVQCSAGTELTLDNANINDSSMSGECGIKFTGSGNMLILVGSNSVYSGSTRAGIEVTGALSISGSGSLYAKGGTSGAGIGGSNLQSCGTISILGGKITAVSGTGAAGIGGGAGATGGSISISAGVVFASGSSKDIGGASGDGSLSISGNSAVFLKNNLAPAASTSTHTLYSNQNVTDGKAYGFSLPSLWQSGDTAYAYLRMYTVSFNTNGGSTVASQQVAASANITPPAEPEKAGLIFGGWYKDSGYIDEFNVSTEKIYSDITIYAKWNVNVKMIISEGGEADPGTDTEVGYNKDLIITCTPDDSYYVGEVKSVSGHTVIDNEDNTYTIKNIVKEDTIKITFESKILLGSVMIEHDGVPEYGDMLSVYIKKITNNPVAAQLKYQWLRDSVEIKGANEATYIASKDDIGKKISVRVSSTAKEGFLESAQIDKIQKAARPAPRAPSMLEKTKYSITLYMLDGCEYKMDDGQWQKSNTFTGLEPETEHTFFQRYAATSTHKSSNSSFSVKITTDGFHVSDLDISINFIRMHLNDKEKADDMMKYSLLPNDARNRNVIWESSNEKVATIDNETGIITAVGVGKAIITLSAEDTTNGAIKDTCVLQVFDPSEASADEYFGILEGILLDENGKPVKGCNITLYSNPVTVTPNEAGEYYLGNIPYTSHTLVVEKESGEEIARFIVSWTAGDKNKAYIDNTNNSINIIYTDVTYSTNIPIVVNSSMDNARIKSANTIVFLDEEGNEIMSKKIYMMVLMGIIAACIIGVGYILYIGRVQGEETGLMEQPESGFYEQQMLSYSGTLDDDEDINKKE
ncbi:MAG: InlB B-repeat-containing protein [Eubacteriales bacterium]